MTQDTDPLNPEVDERKAELLEQLENVIDPELGIDIVNLGLVYDVDMKEEGVAHVFMTLTTPACPLADIIFDEVNREVMALPYVKEVDLELTFYPPWSPDRMSRYAKIALGFS